MSYYSAESFIDQLSPPLLGQIFDQALNVGNFGVGALGAGADLGADAFSQLGGNAALSVGTGAFNKIGGNAALGLGANAFDKFGGNAALEAGRRISLKAVPSPLLSKQKKSKLKKARTVESESLINPIGNEP